MADAKLSRMRPAIVQSEAQPHWRWWETNRAAKTALNSNWDGVRALLILLFYCCLMILFAGVCLFKMIAMMIGFSRRSPVEWKASSSATISRRQG